jgi:hypothetical protein
MKGNTPMNVTIKTNNRSDYNAIFNAIIGDSKHTVDFNEQYYRVDGTMTQSDYDDMFRTLSTRIPTDYIQINNIKIGYDSTDGSFDDDTIFVTINKV